MEVVADVVLDDETDCVEVLVPDMVCVERGLLVLVIVDLIDPVLDGVAVDVRELVIVAVDVRLDVIVAVELFVDIEDNVVVGDFEGFAELVGVRVLVIVLVADADAVVVRELVIVAVDVLVADTVAVELFVDIDDIVAEGVRLDVIVAVDVRVGVID